MKNGQIVLARGCQNYSIEIAAMASLCHRLDGEASK